MSFIKTLIEIHFIKYLFFSYPFLTLPILKEKCLRNYEALARPLRKEFEEPQIERIYQVIKDLPTINVELKIRGSLNDQNDITRVIKQPVDRNAWHEINCNEEYQLIVSLHRLGAKHNDYIYSRFPKPKDECYFITLGDPEKGELIALKRVSMKSTRSTNHLIFNSPSVLGRCILTLYLISDGYIGIDQQFNLQLDVIESSKK